MLLSTVATAFGAVWLASSAVQPVTEIADQAASFKPGVTGQRIQVCGEGLQPGHCAGALGVARNQLDRPAGEAGMGCQLGGDRGLAGAVRPEESERLAGGDVEVDRVDGGERAEPLGQAAGMDQGVLGPLRVGHGTGIVPAATASARPSR